MTLLPDIHTCFRLSRVTPVWLGRHLALLLAACWLSGCDAPPAPEKKSSQAATEAPFPSDVYPQLEPGLVELADRHNARLVAANTGFQDAVTGFLTQRDTTHLTQAVTAWEGFYQAYNASHIWLQLAATLNPTNGLLLLRTDPLPIMPGYIDSLSQWPHSGIVNDVTVPLDRENLIAQHGLTDQHEVSLGFQVIHFLLHGEPDAPRTAADFIAAASPAASPASPVDLLPEDRPEARRARYLRTATQLLGDDVATLTTYYKSGAAWTQFDALPDTQRVQHLLDAVLTECSRLKKLHQYKALTDPAAGDFLHPASQALAYQASYHSLAQVIGTLTSPDDAETRTPGLVQLVAAKSEETAQLLDTRLHAVAPEALASLDADAASEAFTALKGSLRQSASLLGLKL